MGPSVGRHELCLPSIGNREDHAKRLSISPVGVRKAKNANAIFLQQKWHFDESSEPQQQEKCSKKACERPLPAQGARPAGHAYFGGGGEVKV